ncbi:hypothetical protein HPB49_008114 [Dermacentor silvarum]|uniref:Uncharacterized protein n=1 Tax=Dermacentor silvarum TaxID=543639 RepID=A0ACB8CW80_DERSI|nr:hypothetical protein HPB49_008114 [Dermacentor silvarum]
MEPGSTYIPGGFFAVANGWTKSPNGIKMPSDNQLSAFLAACGSRFARQTAKGKKLTEEGYVRNIMFNNLCSTSPYGLLRSICLPSMKGGYYIVHAVIEKGTGDILAGHCLCPAGLSGSCQHVVGLLLTACNLAPQGEDTTCTDVPCAWIVPPQAIQPLSLDDRAVILESTMGQAENKKWHQERIGRLTASMFKKLLRCGKPDGAVRDVMAEIAEMKGAKVAKATPPSQPNRPVENVGESPTAEVPMDTHSEVRPSKRKATTDHVRNEELDFRVQITDSLADIKETLRQMAEAMASLTARTSKLEEEVGKLRAKKRIKSLVKRKAASSGEPDATALARPRPFCGSKCLLQHIGSPQAIRNIAIVWDINLIKLFKR